MNTRKDNNGAALKAWKKMGPAHIAKPLRHIAIRTNGKDPHTGRIILSTTYALALNASRRGRGDIVQSMALSLR